MEVPNARGRIITDPVFHSDTYKHTVLILMEDGSFCNEFLTDLMIHLEPLQGIFALEGEDQIES